MLIITKGILITVTSAVSSMEPKGLGQYYPIKLLLDSWYILIIILMQDFNLVLF